MTTRAVLSIGGNQGDTLALLRAVTATAAADGLLRAWSPVYATPAWGGVEQPDFLNAILVVEHPGTPRDVLEWGFAREREAGRTREVRWGPRTLDVDVVAAEVDGAPVLSDDDELTLPHPRAAERAFVLVPWLAVEPEGSLGGHRLSELVAGLDPDEVAGVRRLDHTLNTAAAGPGAPHSGAPLSGEPPSGGPHSGESPPERRGS